MIAMPFSHTGITGLRHKKHRAVGDMIRKNKETDPPAARVAALTCRFDRSGSQTFKLSSNPGSRPGSEQLGSKVHLAGAKNGAMTQESPNRDRRTSVIHGRKCVIREIAREDLSMIFEEYPFPGIHDMPVVRWNPQRE